MPKLLHRHSLALRSVAALLAVPAAPASAQDSATSFERHLKALGTGKVSPAECRAGVAAAASANGPDLLHGAALCARAAMPVEGSVLVLVGQLRATVDILLLPTATQLEDRRLAPLYGMPGPAEGVTGSTMRCCTIRHSARFLRLLEAWRPAYTPAYDPGWAARKRPDAATYAAAIDRAKADLRRDLDKVIRLDADPEYFAMQRAYNAILAHIPRDGGLAADTPDSKRFAELEMRLRARGLALGVDMGPPPPVPALLAQQASVDDDPTTTRGPGETVVASAPGGTVERCTDQAERAAVRSGGRIARIQITTGSRWGTILRADLIDGDTGAVRFTCSDTFTGEQPLTLERLPSLDPALPPPSR